MVDGKKVDLSAAKREESSGKKPERKTNSGTGGSHEVYDKGFDTAERTAARNQAISSKATADGNDEKVEEKQGFVDRVVNMDLKKFTLFRVLPAIIIAGLIFSLGMCAAPKQEKPVSEPKKVDNVEGAYSVLDKVESLKDDQIKALRKQLAAIEDNQSRVTVEELAAVSKLNGDVANTLNPFFDAVIGIDPQASESELATHQRNLSDYMTNSASTSTLYNLLSGTTPAREVNGKVAKSGGVIPAWVSTSGKNRRTYLVVVPIAMEDGTAKAEYLVSMSDKKIDGIDYLGMMYENTPVEKAVEQHQKAPVDSGKGSRGQSNRSDSSSETSTPRKAGNNSGGRADKSSRANTSGDCSKGDRAQTKTDENGNVELNLC